MPMSDVDVHMYKGYFPWTTRSSTMLLTLQNGMKLTELQTPIRLLIYFAISLLNCIVSISKKSGYDKICNNRKPWLSDGLKSSIRHKNKLYVKRKQVKSAFNEELYKIAATHESGGKALLSWFNC